MKKRILIFSLISSLLFCLSACSKSDGESYLKITFIDVGQGDSALVECDGKYMLIDGGDTVAGNTVYEFLRDNTINKLDILAISHHDKDHIGGLTTALTFIGKIKRTISNSEYSNSTVFRDFERELTRTKAKIEVPKVNKEYPLGSATVKVVDVSSEARNDSLVLLITYGNTRFLFTGDIERNAQLRVAEYFKRESEEEKKWVSLIKMPHHGAYNDISGVYSDNALNMLFTFYDPTFFAISVGEGNQYGHPHDETLDIIENMVVDVKTLDWNTHVKRTDLDGNITAHSDGEKIWFE